jgi:hypothetical protein
MIHRHFYISHPMKLLYKKYFYRPTFSIMAIRESFLELRIDEMIEAANTDNGSNASDASALDALLLFLSEYPIRVEGSQPPLIEECFGIGKP